MSGGRLKSRRSITPEWATQDADLQDVFYGSDGTRTRDLRRDRPVSPLPESPGLSGDSRPEQDLSSAVLRGLPGAGGSLRGPPAGWMWDAKLSRQRTSRMTL